MITNKDAALATLKTVTIAYYRIINSRFNLNGNRVYQIMFLSSDNRHPYPNQLEITSIVASALSLRLNKQGFISTTMHPREIIASLGSTMQSSFPCQEIRQAITSKEVEENAR